MNLKSGSLISKGLLERLKSGRNRLDLTDAEREYLSLLLSTEYHEWHPYPDESPNEDVECLVSIRWTDESIVRFATWSKLWGEFNFDESGEDYWVAKDIANGEATITAWTESPAPYKEASDEQS